MADKKKNTKVSKKVEELVEKVAKLSVMELSSLVNALQDKLGVEAAPMAAAPAAAAAPAESEQGGEAGGGANQTVILTAPGDQKIAVIKALRAINPNLGLKEAKDATESVPFEVVKDAKADDAKEAAEKLKTAGATVELK
jgi:large subunit ribosomal protein L7/L12